MKDRFEEFVRDHQSEFDMFEPKAELWQGIEKKMAQKKVIRWQFYAKRVGAIAAIFIISLLVQRLWVNSSIKDGINTAETEINIPELTEAEMYYSSMMSKKMEEVKPLLTNNPSLEAELNTDLFELDSIYSALKKDLKDNVANQEVIEAMIQNYRLRISILEDMMQYLNDQNETDTSKPNDNEV